jgi:hypothetical protein
MSDISSSRRAPQRRLNEERVAPNIQRVVREVDTRALKQFLGGYIRFHPELNSAMKLLLGVQVGEVAGVDEIYGLIDELWRKNRRKLQQKRARKKFEFLLLSSVGVSADALSEKNYQLAAANSLAMHRWMTYAAEDLYDQDWAIRLYRQLLEVIEGLFKSDIAPQLLNEMTVALVNNYKEPEALPYGGEDIWCQLYASEKVETDAFMEGLVKKLNTSHHALAYLPSFLSHIHLSNEQQRQQVDRWIRSVPAAEVLEVLALARVTLRDKALFFVISISEKWTIFQREELNQWIAPDQQFIADLHNSSLEAPGGIWQELIQRSEWTEKERELLVKYRDTMASGKMVAFAVNQLLSTDDIPLPEMNDWAWKDKLRLMPFIAKSDRKALLRDFKAYCLDYAETHMGNQAIEHIRELGRILQRMNFNKEWSSIWDALQRDFGYRKSFRQW